MKFNRLYSYLPIAGGLCAIVGVVYVAYFIARNLDTLRTIEISFAGLLILMASIFIYLLAVIGGATTWFLLAKATGARISFRFGLWVFLVSQYGKYVPGNIWPFVSRAGLASLGSMHPAHTTYVMLIETVLIILIGMLLALVAVAGGLLDVNFPIGYDLALVIVVAAGFLYVGPKGILTFVRKFSDWSRSFQIPETIQSPNRYAVAISTILSALTFIVNAMVLNLIAVALMDATSPSLAVLTGMFALAWTAGFVTPGAPGGIGIRDGLLVSVLVPFYGPTNAVILAVTHRLVSVAGDTLAFCASVLARPDRREEDRA